ncbi:guanine nucleotide exchange factor SPIKE 1 [Gossypium australe]|uniref:Guanine nucleotide exchange factor SPIKE 1 n=1 Tax=Gossypium australe TaxID=47621 RepID=A0A5B6URD5_9ROSI|nr:guanine nucleotide exchange factor SPIKE 1 [Gossypium australe]
MLLLAFDGQMRISVSMNIMIFFIYILILFTGEKALVFPLRACRKIYDIFIELKTELMAATWSLLELIPTVIYFRLHI